MAAGVIFVLVYSSVIVLVPRSYTVTAITMFISPILFVIDYVRILQKNFNLMKEIEESKHD